MQSNTVLFENTQELLERYINCLFISTGVVIKHVKAKYDSLESHILLTDRKDGIPESPKKGY